MDESKERQLLMTLGKGKKAKEFWWQEDENGITIWAGVSGKAHLDRQEVQQCLAHFAGRWFPMGSSMTEPTDRGLGQYFRDILGMTPRWAGHFSAVLVSTVMRATRST
jgi:hypothetical protein